MVTNCLVTIPSHFPPPPVSVITSTIGAEVINASAVSSESLTWLIPQPIERRTRKNFSIMFSWDRLHDGNKMCLIYHMLSLTCILALVVITQCVGPVCSPGENNILQVMVKVVKGVRPDLGAIPRNRPPACSGFISLMQRCWTTNPEARPSFHSVYLTCFNT